MFTFVLLVFTAILVGVLVYVAKQHSKLEDQVHKTETELQAYKTRFAPVVSVTQEIARLNVRIEEQKGILQGQQDTLENIKQLQADAAEERREEIDALEKGIRERRMDIERLDGTLPLLETGFFEPTFQFDMAERYKEAIQANRAKQKKMIADGKAVFGKVAWQLSGSQAEGDKMVKRAVKLTLRAFNNECEAGIANVTWSNFERTKDRISNAFKDINKLNESNQIVIDEDFLKLKHQELKLYHEWLLKKQAEKEEQAEIRQHLKEEEKAQREAAAAVAAAEKEEEKYQRLLAKAQKEAMEAAQKVADTQTQQDQDRLKKLQDDVAALTQQLAAAHAQNVRALSMAQQTKRGHVYIISNKGSFGEDVFKIGMTRRLDPQDRIDELGDASVPFCFDVHGMIYSDDAPAMENHLHKQFSNKRVNRINERKEFFRVTLDEIQDEVRKIDPNAELVTTMLADEYHQTLAILQTEAGQAVH